MDRMINIFRLRMYESGYEIIDTTVKTKNMQGGRLGKVSNKMISIWEQVIKVLKYILTDEKKNIWHHYRGLCNESGRGELLIANNEKNSRI